MHLPKRADGEHAARLAGEHGLRPLLGGGHLALGRVARRAGDAEALPHPERAAALFGEMDMGCRMEQAEAEKRARAGISKG